MGKARDISKILTTVENIDVTEQLDERIFISSASPTSGNIDGRLWIDTSSASAPVLQTYGSGEFRKTIVNRTKALGGNITQFGAYTIHAFTGSGTFTALEPLNVEYLVVAGGGQGGRNGGGGGAGGLLTGVLSITSGNKTVTVGAGGGRVQDGTSRFGANGQNSVFASITSTGGGGGGGSDGSPSSPGSGGSGGGGARSNDNTFRVAGNNNIPSGEGNKGGDGSTDSPGRGGGGGGAGGAGGNGLSGTSNTGGLGGIGIAVSDLNLQRIGGGGAGGGFQQSQAIGNVDGGGGNPTGNSDGFPGGQNTGGGGGGSMSSNTGNTNQGGYGGSGIVIIKYLT